MSSIQCCKRGLPLFAQFQTILALFVFLFFGISTLQAQSAGDESDIYKGELSKAINLPNTPEAEAFAQYGNVEVSMYSGTPQIGVPLHTIKGRELDVPISLSYDASGIKVEEQASTVGLGWSLAVGGRISRITNGLPDDYIYGSYATIYNNDSTRYKTFKYINEHANLQNPTFSSVPQARQYYEFLYDVNYNFHDTQVDYFKVNAPGLNDVIVFEFDSVNLAPRFLHNPRLEVLYTTGINGHIASWQVTGEDGTVYTFGQVEETERTNTNDTYPPMGDLGLTRYVSSWVLTAITSKNGKDSYTFSYKDEGYTPSFESASSLGAATTQILDNVYTYTTPPNGAVGAVITSSKAKYITGISRNGTLLASFAYGSRYDVQATANNTRLSGISCFRSDGGSLKTFTLLNTDYFNLDAQNPWDKAYSDIRLKLNGVDIKGTDNATYESYAFTYDRPDQLPPRTSAAQDYMGYYNGSGNQNLYQRVETSGFTFAGADRDPDTSSGTIGLLKEITYPTGGTTTFSYEGHDQFKTVSTNGTEYAVTQGVSGNDPSTPELYRDANGFLCDDAYLQYDLKIKIKNFSIVESDFYTFDLASTSNNVEVYVAKVTAGGPSYDNYCDFYFGPYEWHAFSPTNTTVSLTPGSYKVLMLLAEDSVTGLHGSASFGIYRGVINTYTNNIGIGGHRIDRITDKTADGQTALIKQYTYRDDQNRSTAQVNYVPLLYEFKTRVTGDGEVTQLIRYGTSAQGDEPYVVYSRVTESRINAIGATTGKTDYQFYTGMKGLVPNMTPPYENLYVPSLDVGNVAETAVYDRAGTLVQRDQTQYYETIDRPIKVKSLVVHTKEDQFDTHIFFKENNVGQPDYYVSVEYLPTFDCTPEGGASNCSGETAATAQCKKCVLPGYLSNPAGAGYHSYMLEEYSPYAARSSFANGAYGGPSLRVSEQHLPDQNGTIRVLTTQTETDYETAVNSLARPIRVRTTDSKGDVNQQEYTYADQAGITALVSRNRLTEPVTTQVIKNPGDPGEVLVSEVSYPSWSANGYSVMPAEVHTKKGDQVAENRVVFTYYPNGNLKESKKEDGATTTYLWGYNWQYPIAKIDNATAAEVQMALNVGSLNGIDESDLGAVNGLRSSLPTAYITTYTYRPQVGVLTITDPRGYTTNYEYDPFNRLSAVRDAQGNLVTDTKYHYQGQN